jgi:hypothetical protein
MGMEPISIKQKNLIHGGDICHQIFTLSNRRGDGEVILMIQKSILSKSDLSFLGFKELRTLKGKTLFNQVFTIKLQTIKDALLILEKPEILKKEIDDTKSRR